MIMLRATSSLARADWDTEPSDTIVLDYDARHRRRIMLQSVHGLSFLLDLAETCLLRNGDALVLEDQRLIEIVAAPEALTEIICAQPQDLARIAWHLGNRHLPVEIRGKKLRIRRDCVIADMLRGLGARLVEIEAPFEPEGGAYSNLDYTHHHRHDSHSHS
jgi:urease accessory protein